MLYDKSFMIMKIIGDATIKTISGKIWCDSKKKSLSDLLVEVPENEWDWFIYEVSAVGEAPRGLTMPYFESLVLESNTGLKLSWSEVKKFAESLIDLDTCFLAALSKPVEYSRLESGELASCFAIINIIDSTTWEIKVL